MMTGDKGNIKPLLLKVGVALALSFAGFLFSRLRSRRVQPSLHPPTSPRSSDEADSGRKPLLKVEIHDRGTAPSCCSVVSAVSEEAGIPRASSDISVVSISPRSKHSENKDGLLLPEFDEIVKDFDCAIASGGVSPRKDVGTPLDSPKLLVSAEKDEHAQEIRHLRNMVRMLRERERNLEVQLLEYYGLKEQETAVMELQNRLKINNMEGKLFTLKIESLQAENRRLEAQVADHAKVVSELEAARAKIKLLKKKLKSEAESNRQQILNLQQRVGKLQDQECKSTSSNSEVQLRLKRLKGLEDEMKQIRESNMRLQLENSELAQRLDSTQILSCSVLEDPEMEAVMEESERLRQENQELGKKIEQLQADRCADVEELVYLRWINACLRYELRNFQPESGKTVARDLSKSLSPESEAKAKQLILKYAKSDGIGEKGINLLDFDSDQWSSSQASFLSDSGELDETSADFPLATKTNTSSKSKIFSKLRKLLRGKDNHHNNQVLSTEKSGSIEDCDSPRCSSSTFTGFFPDIEGQSSRFATTQCSSRASLDLSTPKSFKEEHSKDIDCTPTDSNLGSFPVYKRSTLKDQHEQHLDSFEKSELVKYATALKGARHGSLNLTRRRSHSSF
ncbi:protein CHUP1, chloroplastic [Ziziphus jujuba]|uniref:Protein CHUP1, chloroplastic n=1 Tax=Ziziphus jujuba TaxID=326968 RepID=A0ABM3IM71_ZIZJJ|nr:protein CHUP1, chloroplastic [Ziziphus jujuba]XP_048331447.2 protein CHUP1, chloroplastic [Ziziphus jujuba]